MNDQISEIRNLNLKFKEIQAEIYRNLSSNFKYRRRICLVADPPQLTFQFQKFTRVITRIGNRVTKNKFIRSYPTCHMINRNRRLLELSCFCKETELKKSLYIKRSLLNKDTNKGLFMCLDCVVLLFFINYLILNYLRLNYLRLIYAQF